MDRTLALYALGTFVAYIVCFKVIEYIIAFLLDDAIVQTLNQNPVVENMLGLALSTIAFGGAFYVVALGRVSSAAPRAVAMHMAAPFALVGLIAIGRGLDTAELLFRLIFIGIVFKTSEYMLDSHHGSRIIDIK